MRLKVLGKYGPFEKENGACSSYLLSFGQRRVLMDLGAGALPRLTETTDIFKVDFIILTHLHFDHISDMLVLDYAIAQKNRREGTARKMIVYAPKTPEHIVNLFKGNSFELRELNEKTDICIDEAEFSFLRTRHPVECYAVKVKCGGKKLVYTADTGLFDGIMNFCRKSDLIIADANFLGEPPASAPHMTVAQAAELALQAGAKKLMLSHQNPFSDEKLILEEASAFPNAFIARERESVEI